MIEKIKKVYLFRQKEVDDTYCPMAETDRAMETHMRREHSF